MTTPTSGETTSETTGRPARTRIVDVAREAGVSAQTVSNVLNGRQGFTPETRERVLDAIARTGYIPDQAGRSLRTGLTRRLAFSMSEENLDPRNPFALTFLRAIIHAAEERDRRVVVFTHGDESDASFRADAAAREVDGFLLANSAPGDPRVAILEELRIPYALMGRTGPGQSQAWVDIDNATAIGGAVDHLVARGFRRIAFASFAGDEYWMRDRLDGTRDRLAHHGLDLPDEWVVRGGIDELGSRLTTLLSSPDRPDAIITASDSIGILAIGVAHSLGLAVGTDLAVTGFDGGVLARSVIPALTTVRVPVADIAGALVHRLVAEIDGADAGGPGSVVPTELVVGGSA